ncbi:MAG: COP23 domain-containing protein [Cyanobacteria bacterium P01_F01_bin.150]
MTIYHFFQQTSWHRVVNRSSRPISFTIATTLLLSGGLSVGSSLEAMAIASPQATSTHLILDSHATSKLDITSSHLISQNGDIQNNEDIDADGTTVDNSRGDADRSTETSFNDRRFTCQYSDGEFIVMYSPEDDPDDYYEWAIPREMGGGWTPERRCNTISDRLEAYRPDGLLELQTSEENGYDIVCATTSRDSACRIVFTVPQGQDPFETRDLVFENLAVANSRQETQGIRTFQAGASSGNILEQIGGELGLNLPPLSGRSRPSSVFSSPERSNSIDLRPFLSPSDGGTGTAL